MTRGEGLERAKELLKPTDRNELMSKARGFLESEENKKGTLEKVLELMRSIDPDKEELDALKKSYNLMTKALEQLGERIEARVQVTAATKCAVCSQLIRRPMGILPGWDKITGLPLQLSVCSQTCFAKAQDEVEIASRERLNARELARGSR